MVSPLNLDLIHSSIWIKFFVLASDVPAVVADLVVVKQRRNDVSWTIKPLSPEALLVAAVPNYVVKVAGEVNSS